jgi:transcription elongation factor SPT6
MDSDDESDHERSRRDSGSGSEKGGERGGDSGGSGVDESDDDGFIVDEEGKPIERKKVKKKHIFDDASKQMAEDIFGVAFDYEEFEQYEGSGPESASDADDVEDMDEDELGERRAARRRRKKPAKTIFDIFDPYELEKGHYTDLDQEIRTTDIPERMQLRQVHYARLEKIY